MFSRRLMLAWIAVALVTGGVVTVILTDLVLRVQLSPEGLTAVSTLALAVVTGVLAIAAFAGIRQTSGLERRHEETRRRAVNARVGVVALALQEHLRKWIDDAPDTVTSIVSLYNDLKSQAVGDLSEALAVPDAMRQGAAGWARDRLTAGVDARIQQLVGDSADVSDEVSHAIAEICVRWVKMNQLFAKVTRDYPKNEVDPKDIAVAYLELRRCVDLLAVVIGARLRRARDLAGVDGVKVAASPILAEGAKVAEQANGDDARYALYDHAHHDLWWAKTQEWSVANWALLLMAGIVGVRQSTATPCNPSGAPEWVYVSLVSLVAVAAGVYFAVLHLEIVGLRNIYRALERKTGIDRVRSEIPQLVDAESDWWRGLPYLGFMVVVITVGTVLALRLVGAPSLLATRVGVGIGLFDLLLLACAALRVRTRDKPAPSDRRLAEAVEPKAPQ